MKETFKELLYILCIVFLFMLMIFSFAYLGIKIDNGSKDKVIDSLKTVINKYETTH